EARTGRTTAGGAAGRARGRSSTLPGRVTPGATLGKALESPPQKPPQEADQEVRGEARRAAQEAQGPRGLDRGEDRGPGAIREAAAQLVPDAAQPALRDVGAVAQLLPQVRDLAHRAARPRAQGSAAGRAEVELVASFCAASRRGAKAVRWGREG